MCNPCTRYPLSSCFSVTSSQSIIGATAPVWYNAAFIIRTTFHDLGIGHLPRVGNLSAFAVFGFTGAATIATWAYLFLAGRI